MTDIKSGNLQERPRTGRPRAFDPEQAVATAMRLFWEKGYDTVGVAELSQTIGINPPSLYAAYGSKRALFQRALDHYAATQAQFFGRLASLDGPAFDTLVAVLEAAARSCTADRSARGCLVMDSTRNCADPDARALTAGVRAGVRENARRLIAAERPEVAETGADYFMFILTAISASAVDGATFDHLRRDLGLAKSGLAALLDARSQG